jgi:hypothetical protein
MNPELETYRLQFEDLKAQARDLTEGLTEAQFNWRPSPDEWSIEECLAHLITTGNSDLKAIEEAIDRGLERGFTASGPFDYGPIDRFYVGMLGPDSRRKLPAPRRFVPLHGQPVTAVLPTFVNLQTKFVLQLERAGGLDLARVKAVAPFPRFLKMSLGMRFALAAGHGRRHIAQARRVWEHVARGSRPAG